MNDQVKTVLAKHIVDTLLALVVGFKFVEGLATVVTEKPVMVVVLLFLVHELGIS